MTNVARGADHRCCGGSEKGPVPLSGKDYKMPFLTETRY